MKHETIILNEEKILDFIWLFILLMAFAIISIPFKGFFEEDIYNKVSDFIVAFFFFSMLYMTRVVFIKDGYMVKGIRLYPFILKKKKILISQINEVTITQDLENYFVISAILKNSRSFEIKKVPNKNPALKELDLIKAHLSLN